LDEFRTAALNDPYLGPARVGRTLVGSIKWLDQATFDAHDLTAPQRHRFALTGESVPLVAVSRSGVSCGGLDAVYGPADLLAAWSTGPT
jgi:hypothetical protein